MKSIQWRGGCAAVLLVACADAPAAVYKCVDASGKQTYQQQPCPTSTVGAKLKTGTEWTPVKGKIFFDPEPRQVGAYKRYVFRLKDENYRGEPVNIEGYVYYDCAMSSIGGPHLRTDYAGRSTPVDLASIESKLAQRAGVAQFSSFRQGGGGGMLPLADLEFVNFACGTPVAATDGLRASGPEAVIHAAKPEGMSISDISFGANNWVKIRGTVVSEQAVYTFLRNLDLTDEFESPSTSGVADNGSFEASVLQSRRTTR